MERIRFDRAGLCLSAVRQGDGPAFVFQHGLCGAAGQTLEVCPADTGWQGLTLECRGHGESDAGDPALFSLAAFADDLAAFIEGTGQAPVVLGGISMGAALALRLAVTRPGLVRGLVLARPAWIAEAGPENLAPNREVARLLAEHGPEEALRRFGSSPLAARLALEAPDNLTSLRGFFTREPLAVTQALLAAIAADGLGITRGGIAAIRVPTLVIGHERDVIHPLAMARELASLIPGARLAVITPKAVDPAAYRSDFRKTLAAFLKEMTP